MPTSVERVMIDAQTGQVRGVAQHTALLTPRGAGSKRKSTL
jgi:hypothetical protein